MKIWAGEVFHQRNPISPPTIAAETTARSNGPGPGSTGRGCPVGWSPPKQDWLNCQNPMTTNEPIAKIDEPAARPSRPSVTLTPLEVAVTIRQTQTTNTMTPATVPSRMKSRSGRSLMNEICVDAGVSPCLFGNWRESQPKIPATMTCPTTLAQPPRPRLRWLRVFRKSSMNPTMPRPTIMKSTSSGDAVNGSPTMSLAAKKLSTTPRMSTIPPMVAVPRLAWWLLGPSSRMNCPQPNLWNSLMNRGVRKRVNTSEMAPAINNALTSTVLLVDRRGIVTRPSSRT